jgi:hypothetical protein
MKARSVQIGSNKIYAKDSYDKTIQCNWKKCDIIRNKLSGTPYFVIHKFEYVCTLIIDMTDTSQLPQSLTLLPKDYDNYALASDMEAEVKKNEDIEWKYNPIL